jgi:putative MATE family efflux protein
MEIFLSSPVTASVPSRAARWFALIKEAILGSKQDFTAISINRAIVLLAVPMVLEMAMESLFGIIDIFFVAHLGADSTATVGITEGMLVLVMAVAFGLSMGTTAVVARRVGEHDQNGAAEAAVQSILIGVGFAVLIFAIAFPFAPQLLRWMGASPGIMRVGSLYTRIMLSSSGIILLLFLINAVFRGAGDAAVAMRVLWLANFINLCLDPCLIRGLGPFPRLGVTGAAVSTSIGRSIGIVFQLYMLSKGSAHLNISRNHIRLKLKLMWNIFEVAGIGVLQLLIATASWLVMVRMVQFFGSHATAGYTVAMVT